MRLALLVVTLAPLFGSGCASMPAPSPAPPQRPLNIVLLYADDWRHDTLGCAGNPVVRTPSIDALAREGVRFTHNGAFPAAEYDFGDWRLADETHWVKGPDGARIHVTEKNERDALEFLRTRPAAFTARACAAASSAGSCMSSGTRTRVRIGFAAAIAAVEISTDASMVSCCAFASGRDGSVGSRASCRPPSVLSGMMASSRVRRLIQPVPSGSRIATRMGRRATASTPMGPPALHRVVDVAQRSLIRRTPRTRRSTTSASVPAESTGPAARGRFP